MQYFVENLRNSFDFLLRNPISRKNYFEAAQDLSGILENKEQEKLYEYLKDKYGDLLSQNTTRRNFLLNIYFLDVFDKYLSKSEKDNLSILDVGSKNWEYVKSEYVFFKSFLENFNLNGIELDANRMCSNFYNRYEIAKFYTKGLSNTKYIHGDFTEHNQKYDYIIWILPFITEYPHVKWGLPLKYFKPKEMLIHAYDSLNQDGELLIINQGGDEYSIQQKLVKETFFEQEGLLVKNLPQTDLPRTDLPLTDLPPIYLPLGEIEDRFGLFKNKRYCSKLVKRFNS